MMNVPENPVNEEEQVKAMDLSPAMLAKESAPKKTWFFQRGDGMTFACEEKEAWDIVNNRSEWKRRDFKLLGVSDGKTYQKIVKESMAEAKKLEPEIVAMKADLKKYMRAEENLLVNEAVDMEGDPSDQINEENKKKVLRLRDIMTRLNKALDVKEEEYRNSIGGVVERATAAELKVARGVIEWPSQMNIITPDASPQERDKILRVMGHK